MDLQEEYFRRRKVPAHLIRYVDRGNLLLRAKNPAEHTWIHVNLEYKQENNHPAYYYFSVSANPVILANADFSNFGISHSKVLREEKIEWDQYEYVISNWVQSLKGQYFAIPSTEAIFVSWEMFLENYDYWFANFLPHRVIDWLASSLVNDTTNRLNAISEIEDWLKDKHERVFVCWRGVRNNLDHKNYADWLAEIVNKS